MRNGSSMVALQGVERSFDLVCVWGVLKSGVARCFHCWHVKEGTLNWARVLVWSLYCVALGKSDLLFGLSFFLCVMSWLFQL